MNKLESFEQFLTQSGNQISVISFTYNFIIAAILAILLAKLYVSLGNSISNRHIFSKNFLALTLTTMIIITIVKSSLALSLGLVGALSIIRFRAAIKEPEELTYVFISISIGLGLGANQTIITVLGFSLLSIALYLRQKFGADNGSHFDSNLILRSESNIKLKTIIACLEEYAYELHLRRLDDVNDIFEAHFQIQFKNSDSLEAAKTSLKELDQKLSFRFMDISGVY